MSVKAIDEVEPLLTCRDCARFVDDPAAIEAALPGLTALGSAYGSVRGDAGICEARGRFMEPVDAAGCEAFARRRLDEGGCAV